MRKSLATATLAALFAALTFFSPSAQTYSQDAVTKWFTDMTAAMNDKEVGIENLKKISASACTQASEIHRQSCIASYNYQPSSRSDLADLPFAGQNGSVVLRGRFLKPKNGIERNKMRIATKRFV